MKNTFHINLSPFCLLPPFEMFRPDSFADPCFDLLFSIWPEMVLAALKALMLPRFFVGITTATNIQKLTIIISAKLTVSLSN